MRKSKNFLGILMISLLTISFLGILLGNYVLKNDDSAILSVPDSPVINPSDSTNVLIDNFTGVSNGGRLVDYPDGSWTSFGADGEDGVDLKATVTNAVSASDNPFDQGFTAELYDNNPDGGVGPNLIAKTKTFSPVVSDGITAVVQFKIAYGSTNGQPVFQVLFKDSAGHSIGNVRFDWYSSEGKWRLEYRNPSVWVSTTTYVENNTWVLLGMRPNFTSQSYDLFIDNTEVVSGINCLEFVSDYGQLVLGTVHETTGIITTIHVAPLYYCTFNNLPEVNFFASETSVLQYQPVQFTFTGTGGDAPATFAWNFGDGQLSTQENPLHYYTSAGTYTVSLTVTDGDGDNDTHQEIDYITVNPDPDTIDILIDNFTGVVSGGRLVDYADGSWINGPYDEENGGTLTATVTNAEQALDNPFNMGYSAEFHDADDGTFLGSLLRKKKALSPTSVDGTIFTIQFKIASGSTNGEPVFASSIRDISGDSCANSWFRWNAGQGKWQMQYRTSGTWQSTAVYIDTGAWNTIGYELDFTSQQYKLYLNGTEVVSSTSFSESTATEAAFFQISTSHIDTPGTICTAYVAPLYYHSNPPPNLELYDPDQGEIFDTTEIYLNYSASDTDLDTVWYEIDGTNPTEIIANGSITVPSGIHTLTLHVNDSSGTTVSESVTIMIELSNIVLIPGSGTYSQLKNAYHIEFTIYMDQFGILHFSAPPVTDSSLEVEGINGRLKPVYQYSFDILVENASNMSYGSAKIYYDPENLPSGVTEEQLIVLQWNEIDGKWEAVTTIINKAGDYVEFTINADARYMLVGRTANNDIIIIIIIISGGCAAGIVVGVSYSRSKKKKMSLSISKKKKSGQSYSEPKEVNLAAYRKRERLMRHAGPTEPSRMQSKELNPFKKKARVQKTEQIDVNKRRENIQQIEKTVGVKKDIQICLIHRGPISGLNYKCKGCGSNYCMPCATHLATSGESCWNCGAPLPGELRRSTEKDEAGIPVPKVKVTMFSRSVWEKLVELESDGRIEEEFLSEVIAQLKEIPPEERLQFLETLPAMDSELFDDFEEEDDLD